MAKYRGKPQYFEPKYKETLITGLLGCRWRRYKQIKQHMTKCDIFWAISLISVTVFCFYWFYFWLVSINSSNLINRFMYSETGIILDYHLITMILAGCTFSYLFLLIMIALLHTLWGHQIWIHYVHRVVLCFILAFCILMVGVIHNQWSDGFILTSESLMITAPILHICIVFLFTLLSWFVFKELFQLHKKVYHYGCLTLYCVILLSLYVWPLFLDSPCITDRLPPQPVYVAHKGASALAPENTLEAFRLAGEIDEVTVLESDVSISYDGVPFVLHDATLPRTTDVRLRFPRRALDLAASFNISDLQDLSAGTRFLEDDLYGTVSGLSEETKLAYAELKIPTLAQYLQVAIDYNKAVMFDIKYQGEVDDHPYNDNYTEVISEVINASGIDKRMVWWLYDKNNSTKDYRFVVTHAQHSVEELNSLQVDTVNVGFANLDLHTIRKYNENSTNRIWTNVYVIDAEWTHSLFWCMGVSSITTNRCDLFSKRTRPLWHMTKSYKLLMCLLTDSISLVVIILLFIYQRKQRYRSYKTKETVLSSRSHVDYGASSDMTTNRITPNMSLDGGFVNFAEIELRE